MSKATKNAKEGADLTPRERDVLVLVAKGFQNKEIAKLLGISYHTVDDMLRGVYRKLGVDSRAAAAVCAAKQNLV